MKPYRKLLEQKAKALDVPNIKALTEDELKQQIKDRGGVVSEGKGTTPIATAGREGAKAVEVLPPRRLQPLGEWPNVNVKIDNVHVNARGMPEAWEGFMQIKDWLLFAALGSFITLVVVFAIKGF